MLFTPITAMATSSLTTNSLPLSGSPSPRRYGHVVWLIAVPLLFAHWLLAFGSTLEKSLTYDEGAHLFSGVVYWLKGDFRFHCENGNLSQRWCAIPAVLSSHLQLPSSDQPFWIDAQPREGANSFLYECGNDPQWLIRSGRAWCALWGVGICALVFVWSRQIFGDAGAILSLASCVFCPTLLANGPLMTSDACLSFFLLLATYSIWTVLHQLKPQFICLTAVSLAGLFLAKTSAVLIIPIATILVLTRLLSERPREVQDQSHSIPGNNPRIQLPRILATAFLCGATTWSAVWAAFDMRYSPVSPQDAIHGNHEYFRFGSLDNLFKQHPKQTRAIRLLAQAKILPEPYLYGAAYVAVHRERISFLNGSYALGGFKTYFPYTLIVKTPIGTLSLLALAAFSIFFASRSGNSAGVLYCCMPLIVLICVYLGIAVVSGLNIGHRHILPIYPAIHILLGGATLWAAKSPFIRGVLIAFACLFMGEVALARPNFLAYFNGLISAEHRHEHLVESSLDWGQDLPSLKKWLDQNNTEMADVFLAYFGTDVPAKYGIQAVRIPETGSDIIQQPLSLRPGIYCVSATTLIGVYTPRPGPWSVKHEEAYTVLKKQITTSPEWDTLRALERARYLRLLAYLRHHPSVANIGGSILVFRLNQDQIREALEGPPAELELLPLSEQLRIRTRH